MQLVEEQTISQILQLKRQGLSNREIARRVFAKETKESTVRGVLNRYPNYDSYFQEKELNEQDIELQRKQKQVQRLQDINTALRREVREQNRDVNYLENIFASLQKQLDNYKFTEPHQINNLEFIDATRNDNKFVGVIQLSDLHLGERVEAQLTTQAYDFDIAASRLSKYAEEADKLFSTKNIKKILIACTGDLINSDRRLDEVTLNSNSRAKTTLQAVDILNQFIFFFLNKGYKVFVASVIGNESRINKDVSWTNLNGSDNFDFLIHEILSRIDSDIPNLSFVPMQDMIETVVQLGDFNLCLTHGNNRLASPNPSTEVEKLKARFLSEGIQVDYVIFGHIHSTMITDTYARSASLAAGNSYSAKALNIGGSKASQNLYVVDTEEVTIQALPVDLTPYTEGGFIILNEEVPSRYKERETRQEKRFFKLH